MNKRTFLKNASLLGLAVLPGIEALRAFTSEFNHLPPDDLAKDEAFWEKVRSGYRIKPDYINLENGYYCMMPEETLEHCIEHIRYVNLEASHYMRTIMEEKKLEARVKVAKLAGCQLEELIITRNTTESLDLVIGGLHWKVGDEAVMAEQDYGAMLNMFRLVKERYGVVNKVISLPNHPKNDEEIVKLYEQQITSRTKLLMVSHVVNINGQVLPVRKICDMAKKHGVEVMVDGAHAFAHLNFSIPDLNCDYYGTSLHKWLSAPLGAGALYVRKGYVSKLWPLFAESEMEQDDILSLNHMGTTPVHVDLGIINAVDYHYALGRDRKEERLKFLKEYWTSQVKDEPKIIINTPWEKERSCAIANVLVEGMKATDMARKLMDDYHIWTVAIDRPNVHGCRITPNVFTTTTELDVLVRVLRELAKS